MAYSVTKSSNLTASLRAKQLLQSFPRFYQMELTFHKKNTKIDKNVRKLVVNHAKLLWL